MFLNPLGLLALLGVPAVIALHLFRRRFERRRVSALFLWQPQSSTMLSGRRRENLLRSPSFWCELLLALCLGLAIAGPRGCGSLEARHLVVVLDGSASMAAGEAATSRTSAIASPAELALETLESMLDDLPSGSRVTVVESGTRPRILVGPGAFPRESSARLGGYDPSAGRHDLGPALSLALEIAGSGGVTLFTDRLPEETLSDQVHVIASGAPLDNLAITRAHRSLIEDSILDEEEVLLTVANFSRGARSARVELVTNEAVLVEQRIELAAGERQHLNFRLQAGVATVEARLQGDALSIDDSAWLAPAPLRALRLATTLEPEERKHLRLERSDEQPLKRWLAMIPRSSLASSTEEADLVLAHEVVGGPATWCLTLETAGAERLDLIGPFLIEKRHPLLEGLTLDGVVWSASPEVQLLGTPIISVGNSPLLTEERIGARRIYHANLDWARSSLQRTPDWPILLHNFASLRRDELAGARSTNLAIGEVFYYQADEAAEYELTGPGGARELKALGTLAIDELDRVGLYRLNQGGATVAEFAVHFGDDAESDLRQLDTGVHPSSVELAAERSGSSWVVVLLATLAALALLADWWFLRAPAAAKDTLRATRVQA